MRLIDADALLKLIEEHSYLLCDYHNSRDKGMFLCGIQQAISEMPTVEQKHGHWIVIEKDVTGYTKYECSNCGKTDDDYSEPIFCKHCGCANGRTGKMDEVIE